MAGKELHYFAGGNTARGFYSLYDSNLAGLSRLFILKGGPGTGKSSLMKKIASVWFEKGYDIEYLHCSSDNDSIDGIVIRQLNAGIVDGTAPHIIEPKAPGAVEEYVNLGEAWNSRKLAGRKSEVLYYGELIRQSFEKAYALFAEALRIHDEWETIYIKNIDFQKADALAESIRERLFGRESRDKTAVVRRRYLGAATPQGPVDFISNLTEDLPRRYFLKGRPGSGKSTLLKKLAAHAEKNGFDTEVYHCGFDPYSIDMVIVRELGFAIFDSTAPHEYFPDRTGDEVIDMYKEFIRQGTDEAHAEEIGNISARYKSKMKEAISSLAEAKKLHDSLEEIYVQAMDFSKVDEFAEAIDEEFRYLEANRAH